MLVYCFSRRVCSSEILHWVHWSIFSAESQGDIYTIKTMGWYITCSSFITKPHWRIPVHSDGQSREPLRSQDQVGQEVWRKSCIQECLSGSICLRSISVEVNEQVGPSAMLSSAHPCPSKPQCCNSPCRTGSENKAGFYCSSPTPGFSSHLA